MKVPQNMDFKGLIGKICWNKDLAPQIQQVICLPSIVIPNEVRDLQYLPMDCHPERSEGSAACGKMQIPHFVRDDNTTGRFDKTTELKMAAGQIRVQPEETGTLVAAPFRVHCRT
jgi:hypothetical protein